VENANFDFAAFLAIFVTCNFAQTFSIDSTHWHGGRVKILQMRNSCNLIKLGCKDFHFFSISIFSNGLEYWRSVCACLHRSGLSKLVYWVCSIQRRE